MFKDIDISDGIKTVACLASYRCVINLKWAVV